MALIGNHSVLNKSHAFFTNGTATAGAYAANTKSNWNNPSYFSMQRFTLYSKTSFTEGLNLHEAYLGAWKSGGIASVNRIEGTGSFSGTALQVKTADASFSGIGQFSNSALSVIVQGASSIAGVGNISTATALATSSLASTIAGLGSISASLSALIPASASLSGSGAVTSNLKGYGAISALIEVGEAAELTPGDIWNYDISAINTSGTAGDKLNDAGSAGNPWAASLASNNDSGTFGWFIQKLLTVSKFLGLK